MSVLDRAAKTPTWTSIAGLVWLVAVVLVSSDAGTDMISFLVIFYSGAALAAGWVVRLLLWVSRRRSALQGTGGLRGRLAWMVIPGALILGAAANASTVPFQVRLWLSEPALLEHVEFLRQNPDEAALDGPPTESAFSSCGSPRWCLGKCA